MKKIIIVCVVGIVLSFASLASNAKNDTSKSSSLNNYVDINDDGICDNKNLDTNTQKRNNYVDNNNDGVCDNKSINTQGNNNYVDSNNDNMCDNINNKHHHRYRNK